MVDSTRKTRLQLWNLVAPDAGFVRVMLVYGIAISLLTLALPIAVQTLINTIANIGAFRAVVILALVLFLLLSLSGALIALRMWATEIYQRRVYARLAGEMSLKVILAPYTFFEGRQNAGLVQRYFDIMILQKNMPTLVVDAFSVLLHAVVGMTLVSFYHPWLLMFNVLVLLILFVGWRFWDQDAKQSALGLSKQKYAMGKWLMNLESAHEFFKSSAHLDYAAERTEHGIAGFVRAHALHFRYTFRQALLFITVYAAGSAVLLGLGGWLVVRGQLSIGQLVAAELIMSSVFVSLPRLSTFLKAYYELFGVADKITEVISIPEDSTEARPTREIDTHAGLECHDVLLRRNDQQCRVNFKLKSGAKLLVHLQAGWLQRQLSNVLRSHIQPDGGWVKLNGNALDDYNAYELRQRVLCIDRSLIVECSIDEYLRLASPDAGSAEIIDVLEQVQLHQLISQLPEQRNTRLSSLGAPLQPNEFLRLKLAAALLAKPDLLIINQNFDSVARRLHRELTQVIASQPFNVVYFTAYTELESFDAAIELDPGAGSMVVLSHQSDRVEFAS